MVNPTYPGVYIEEIPSGVHTITGVATSITAFVGRTKRGPAGESFLLNSYADFERNFGGLGVDFPLSYAVQDFYLNGGSQAIIVRLFKRKTDTDTGVATINVGTGAKELKLVASNPGKWGNDLHAAVDLNNISQDVADRYGVALGDLFNLTVTYTPAGKPPVTERIVNLTHTNGPRRADRIISQVSQFVAVAIKNDGTPDLPTTRPDAATADATVNSGNDGTALGTTDYTGSRDAKTGIFALEKADLFNLLCIPPDTRGGDTDHTVYQAAMAYCQTRRALLIVDPPAAWSQNKNTAAAQALAGLAGLGLNGQVARNAALYFPHVIESDPLLGGQPDTFVPCGIIAGIMARTDSARGVWKAPAGLDASINGIQGLDVTMTDLENGNLNQVGINCLRTFPVSGSVVWGARTLRGADQLADEYKYVPVRRLALYLEESLYRGLQWAVFEPNDEPLWAQIRLNVGAFMNNLFRKGAFQGQTPREAYLVKCDKETTTQNDINLGIVNVLVGFAPLKPAEFVIIQIQQLAGQIAV